MKTIMIVVGGLADLPAPSLQGNTALAAADTPGLDTLAQVGCCGLTQPIPENVPLTPATSLLGLLGYDFERGLPSLSALQGLGAGNAYSPSELRYFVIPKFSGHGIVITDNDLARGIGMMALMRPAYTIDSVTGHPHATACGTLADKALATIRAIDNFDFVLVYVDEPLVMSYNGDLEGKIKAIEDIDRELIRPVADHVWNSKLQMNLVVASNCVASTAKRGLVRSDVPAVVYFNDDLPYDQKGFTEQTVADGPLQAPLAGDLMRLLVTFEPISDDSRLPF